MVMDVTGMKRMIIQVVLLVASMVETWAVQLITVATAIVSLVKTLPIGLIKMVMDVTGMKRMIIQVVLLMAILVETWELQMRTAATA